VRVLLQVLSPCVQHGKKTDLAAQMFWVGGDLYKSLRAGLECGPLLVTAKYWVWLRPRRRRPLVTGMRVQ